MEDISKSRLVPVAQNFNAIQAENIHLKKSNLFLVGILILGIITIAILTSINKPAEEKQK